MKIRELVEEAHGNAKAKGWWDTGPCWHRECDGRYPTGFPKRDAKDCTNQAVFILIQKQGNLRLNSARVCAEHRDAQADYYRGNGQYGVTVESIDRAADVPEKLALIHSEVSEALECYRDGEMEGCHRASDGKLEGFPSEIADIVIRCADLCGWLRIDLESVIADKMAFNRNRPYRHGGKRA